MGYVPLIHQKKNVFVKTRWTTTASTELYPIFTDRDLLLGKNKRVEDSHRQKVTKEWLGDIMKCQKLDGLTNIRGIYFDYIDSRGTPSASHFTHGLVEVELNQNLKRSSTREVKPSAEYVADVIEHGLVDPDETTTTKATTTTTVSLITTSSTTTVTATTKTATTTTKAPVVTTTRTTTTTTAEDGGQGEENDNKGLIIGLS